MKPHTPGYWVNQLTTEEIEAIIKSLTETNKNVKLNKVKKIIKSEEFITVVYEVEKLNAYIRFSDRTTQLHDYFAKGKSLEAYVTSMANIFNEVYVEDFNAYVEEFVLNKPSNSKTKTFINAQTSINNKFKAEENNL